MTAAPTNLILDAEGKMVFRHVGFGAGGEKTMEAEIRDLLGLDPFQGIDTNSTKPR